MALAETRGVGLRLGYALLGACRLVRKCEADDRDAAYRLIPYLLVYTAISLSVFRGKVTSAAARR